MIHIHTHMFLTHKKSGSILYFNHFLIQFICMHVCVYVCMYVCIYQGGALWVGKVGSAYPEQNESTAIFSNQTKL